MEFLRSVKEFFRPVKIADLEHLRGFLESRAAYLAQKPIMEYSQARANVLFSSLMREPLFLEAYEQARWRSYPAALSMVCQAVESLVRQAAATPPGALDGGLVRLAKVIVSQFPGPSGLGEAFWQNAADQISHDLAQAALGPPKEVQAIPFARAQEIFDALPASPEIKQHDFAMFRNTLRLHLTEIAAEFEQAADFRKLAAALTGASG